jgi:hypothetical protein
VCSTAAYATYNYLSLFIYESSRHLRARYPDLADELPVPSEEELARSRHSTKLFDDTKKGIEGVVDYFENEIATAHTGAFLGNTKFRFLRWLETDLGLYTYDRKVVGTTHGATFGTGVDPNTLVSSGGPRYVGAIATDYGRFFSAFWDRSYELGPSFVDKLDVKKMRSMDVRASRYYARHFNGAATPGINALLAVFQASLNFLSSMLPFDDLPESRQTILKMQFITLYHVTSSLKILREQQAGDLNPQSVSFMSEALDDHGLDFIAGDASRKFRNTLIHYGLHSGFALEDFVAGVPFYGLIEKYFRGWEYERLKGEVGTQIDRLSLIFDKWSKGAR